MAIRSVNWLKMHVMSLCRCWLGRRDQVPLMRCIFHSVYGPNAHFTVRTDRELLLRFLSVCVDRKSLLKTHKSFTVIIRNSDICLTINSLLPWPKDDKIKFLSSSPDILVLIVSMLALSQSQTFFSSVLTTVSRAGFQVFISI